MLSLIVLILSGVLLGWLLRGHDLRWTGRATTLLVWVLLFLLGVEAGSNPRVIGGLSTLGLEAALVAVAGMVGSCLCARLLWGVISGREKGADAGLTAEHNALKALRGSVVIVAFFAAGCACGVSGIMPSLFTESDMSFYALCALILSVGMGVGSDTRTLHSFRKLGIRYALLPVCTMVGTLVAVAIASLGLPHRPLPDVLASGAGFAYYSLSSILITEYRGPELGTMALLANVFREVITLLGAPLIKRVFGPLAPISCGGAASMDSTLPVITQVCGKEMMPVSVFHGFVVDTSVPFWVTFFCTL